MRIEKGRIVINGGKINETDRREKTENERWENLLGKKLTSVVTTRPGKFYAENYMVGND